MRANAFGAFMADRQKRLLDLIDHATGKAIYAGGVADGGEDAEADPDAIEAEKTMAAV